MEVRRSSKTNTNNKAMITGLTTFGRLTAITFNMTVKDAVASRDVVSSILLVNSMDAYVLFDSGATCSFMSHKFAQFTLRIVRFSSKC